MVSYIVSKKLIAAVQISPLERLARTLGAVAIAKAMVSQTRTEKMVEKRILIERLRVRMQKAVKWRARAENRKSEVEDLNTESSSGFYIWSILVATCPTTA